MAAAKRQRRFEYPDDITFLNSDNVQIAGMYAFAFLSWQEMEGWLEIVITTPRHQYSPFRCLEEGDPSDPLHLHGDRIEMHGNTGIIEPGYYVILTPQGNEIKIDINEEVPAPRPLSKSVTTPDPLNGYRVYSFMGREHGGTVMMRNAAAPAEQQPQRELLQRHFRMCVLVNIKGRVGYVHWDEDMPPGYDHLAEVSSSEQGKLRLEAILANKLYHLVD